MSLVDESWAKVVESVRKGNLTPAKKVQEETLICIVSEISGRKIYTQYFFKQLSKAWQEAMKNKCIGDKVREHKIMAVFDVWE